LLDRDGREKTILGIRTAFRVGDTLATVEGIEKDAVSLKVHENVLRWKLGTSFAELVNRIAAPNALAEHKATESPAKEHTANDSAI